MDGKRTLLVPLDEESTAACGRVGLFTDSSSLSEFAYASPPYSDSDVADIGDLGDGSKSLFCGSIGLEVSIAGSLFLNFSKKGSLMDDADGVVGVGGTERS